MKKGRFDYEWQIGKITLYFKWYDFWVGIFPSQPHNDKLYITVIPMFGFIIRLKERI